MNLTNENQSFSHKVVFAGSQGDQLAAVLDLPARKLHAFALFAHCFTCSKDSLAAFRVSKALTECGIAVLRFDFTGLGGSQGDFANTNFSSNIEDLLKAVEYLRKYYQAPQILIGHSLGGAAVLIAAPHIEEAKAIATIAAPADAKDITKLFTSHLTTIQAQGEAEVNIAGRQFRVKQQFFTDLEKHKLLDTVAMLNQDLLLFHSPDDQIVHFENAIQIFNAANTSKSIISLDNANHLLSRKEDAIYVANILATWVKRHIATQPVTAESSAEVNNDQVVVQKINLGKFTQEITVGNHQFLADEPINAGGNDLGPGPYDFLLSALGACKAMTMLMYANLKQIPLTATTIKLNHSKVYIEDCQTCESPKSKIDQIEVAIELHGELNQEQRTKLLDIANKCPVHRTLTSHIEIMTRLAEELNYSAENSPDSRG